MSTYITEEEQVEAIKSFFKQHSQKISIVLLVILVIFGGVRYASWHAIKMKTDASMVYETLMVAVAEDDHKKIHAFASRLIQTDDKTLYADFARLLLAKCDMSESQVEKAKSLLSEVAQNSRLNALRQVARLRLARVLLSEKNDAAALSTLETVDDKHYQNVIATLRDNIKINMQSRK